MLTVEESKPLTEHIERAEQADLQDFALLHLSLNGEVQARHLTPQPLTLPIHPLLSAPAHKTKFQDITKNE